MKLLVATLTPFDSRGRDDLGRLRAHVLWLRLQRGARELGNSV